MNTGTLGPRTKETSTVTEEKTTEKEMKSPPANFSCQSGEKLAT